MSGLLMLLIAGQGLAILVDEFYYHHRRGLGRWEILGHPLDTLTVLSVYAFLLLTAPSATNSKIFLALAAFSSIFVTKDEWVHAELCEPGEHWLHSLLFLLHPTAFLAAGWLWHSGADSSFLAIQAGLVALFFLYQISYWGLFAKS